MALELDKSLFDNDLSFLVLGDALGVISVKGCSMEGFLTSLWYEDFLSMGYLCSLYRSHLLVGNIPIVVEEPLMESMSYEQTYITSPGEPVNIVHLNVEVQSYNLRSIKEDMDPGEGLWKEVWVL